MLWDVEFEHFVSFAFNSGLLRFEREALYKLLSVGWLVMICFYSYWCVWRWYTATHTDVSGDWCYMLPLALLLFQISSVACLACLCSSGTVKVGLFMLPLIGRLRLMMFVTVFSLLVTCLFIFLDISHIVYFFPFNWGKLVSGFISLVFVDLCLYCISF